MKKENKKNKQNNLVVYKYKLAGFMRKGKKMLRKLAKKETLSKIVIIVSALALLATSILPYIL